MNLRYLFISVVSIYGVLSIIAAIGGMIESDFRGSLALFMIAGIALVLSPWVPNTLVWLLVALIGLHVAAIWQGFSQDSFTSSHHIVRAIVSVAIVMLYLRSEH